MRAYPNFMNTSPVKAMLMPPRAEMSLLPSQQPFGVAMSRSCSRDLGLPAPDGYLSPDNSLAAGAHAEQTARPLLTCEWVLLPSQTPLACWMVAGEERRASRCWLPAHAASKSPPSQRHGIVSPAPGRKRSIAFC